MQLGEEVGYGRYGRGFEGGGRLAQGAGESRLTAAIPMENLYSCKLTRVRAARCQGCGDRGPQGWRRGGPGRPGGGGPGAGGGRRRRAG